jgi:sugar O-acyltransferase (sialic acid O-acetyltransferase NeuD family)
MSCELTAARTRDVRVYSETLRNECPIVVLGGGGHARVVADACRCAGLVVRGFLNKEGTGESWNGLPVLGGDERLSDASFIAAHDFVPAVGDQEVRRHLAAMAVAAGARLVRVVHPRACVAVDVRIGPGSVVLAGAIVGTGTRLGACVIVNTGATVDHDNALEDGVQIGPGAHLGGAVTCREDAMIGMGATVLPGLTVGRAATVAAGAVVTRDVSDHVLVMGCPARAVNRHASAVRG